jgi:transposase
MANEQKRGPGRYAHFTDEFKTETARLAETSGCPLRVTAGDLGIGLSTLGKWISAAREADILSGPHEDTAKELARLRKENEILRQERDFLKKETAFLAKKASVPIQRACALLAVPGASSAGR